MKISLNGTHCTLHKAKYSNGRVALTADDLTDGMPYATLTVNLVNETINKDEAFIDINNCPWAIEDLQRAKVIPDKPLRKARSDYVLYPLYKINF